MTGSRSLPLLRVFGIRVGVNYSWFLVLFLVIFILWDSLNATLDASADRHPAQAVQQVLERKRDPEAKREIRENVHLHPVHAWKKLERQL